MIMWRKVNYYCYYPWKHCRDTKIHWLDVIFSSFPRFQEEYGMCQISGIGEPSPSAMDTSIEAEGFAGLDLILPF